MNWSSIRPILVLLLSLGFTACDFDAAQSDRVLAEGLSKAQAGQYTEALNAFDDAIRTDPDNADAYYNRGVLRLQQLSNPGGAIDDLNRAVEIRPEWAEAHLQLGVALLETGRENQAYDALKKSMELGSSSAGAAYRIGQLEQQDGNYREAIDAYTTAIYSNARTPEPYSALGRLYLEFGHYAEARQVFENGVENNPNDPQLRADLGQAALEEEDYTSAIQYLREAIQRGDSRLSTVVSLAEAYRGRHKELGDASDVEEAKRYFQSAVQRCSPREHGASMCRTLQDTLKRLQESTAE
jgi:tetratricopeptide (TPR) repeat protein